MVEAAPMTPDEVIEWLESPREEDGWMPSAIAEFSAMAQTVRAMRDALIEMLAAYGPWTGKTVKQEDADQAARSSLSPKEGKT